MEKYIERKKDLHLVFIDLEKTYNNSLMKAIWRTLEATKVSRCYLMVILDMYYRFVFCVRTIYGNTESFHVGIGLHQGSTLTLKSLCLL